MDNLPDVVSLFSVLFLIWFRIWCYVYYDVLGDDEDKD
jgi:hypothetical protein